MLGPIFLTLRNIDTKGLLAQVLKVSLRLTPIQKGDLCPSRLLSLITDFSVFVPLQDIAPESSWLKDFSLKDCKIVWKINVREMKTELYLETLVLLWIKMDRDGGNKTKKFYRCLFIGPGYTESTLI